MPHNEAITSCRARFGCRKVATRCSMAQTRAAQLVRWRGVVVFLLLAFGLAWIPFLLLQANANPVVQVLILLLQFSPAIAAALVRGPLLHEGFADSGLRLNLTRRQ